MVDIKALSTRLNVPIKDVSLYELALTHPSYNAEVNTKHHDYERLEFMGDAVLSYVSADLIFNLYPSMDQGVMSKLRSYIVKGKSLASFSREINLVDFIKTGHSIPLEQLNQSDKILEDIFEALIGAIYIDNGMEIAFNFIKSFIYDKVKNFDLDLLTDYKTRLQEEMQSEYRDSVHYELVEAFGPMHDRTFVVNVLFGNIVLGTGRGKSKKAAEEDAAKDALSKRRT